MFALTTLVTAGKPTLRTCPARVGVPWQSSGQDATLSLPRAQVQPQVRELRSRKLHDAAKAEKKGREKSLTAMLAQQRLGQIYMGIAGAYITH